MKNKSMPSPAMTTITCAYCNKQLSETKALGEGAEKFESRDRNSFNRGICPYCLLQNCMGSW